MESWLNTSHLKQSEKICKKCLIPFSGNEVLLVHSNGIVVVKWVECSNCDTKFVLDVIRHDEIY